MSCVDTAAELNELFRREGVDAVCTRARSEPTPSESTEPRCGRYLDVPEDVQAKVVKFNKLILPRIEQGLMGSAGTVHFRRLAIKHASKAFGVDSSTVDVSRVNHDLGYGDVHQRVLLEHRTRNRKRRHDPMTHGSQDELCGVQEAAEVDDETTEAVAVSTAEDEEIADIVRNALLVATKAAQALPKDQSQMRHEELKAADADVKGREICQAQSAGKCACAMQHRQALSQFVTEYRASPGACFDLIGLNLTTRRELHHTWCHHLEKVHRDQIKLVHLSLRDAPHDGVLRVRLDLSEGTESRRAPPGQAPLQAPVQAPVQTTAQAPVQAPVQSAAQATVQAPKVAPKLTPPAPVQHPATHPPAAADCLSLPSCSSNVQAVEENDAQHADTNEGAAMDETRVVNEGSHPPSGGSIDEGAVRTARRAKRREQSGTGWSRGIDLDVTVEMVTLLSDDSDYDPLDLLE